ncbi:hypothetical protein S40285_10495 [Stachybotrys chlorohalonatus IBT 40285]|uniref:Uncharacterized protein n=1 Tax=Stachybotrys chlorohalonatus (strain IBT 40285) TaxID=1283841 RepID=A0A084Q9M5_STAC4|nr:hypothetical protein S40285_10495 [Stachybotrys chlorohalonata IBT 40285]
MIPHHRSASRGLAPLLQDSAHPMPPAPHHGDDAAHREEDGHGNGLMLDVWIADFGESGVAGDFVDQGGDVPKLTIHKGLPAWRYSVGGFDDCG